MAKGRQYDGAVVAIEKVIQLGHYRSETVLKAVNATLGYIGARRIAQVACSEIDSPERRLLNVLAEAEVQAARLDAIPQRVETGNDRAEVWASIVGTMATLRLLLDLDRRNYNEGRERHTDAA